MIIDALERLAWRAIEKRPADLVIRRGRNAPYLYRWHVVRSRFFNIYVHHFASGDPDDVLHDHPWGNLTICLNGGYSEELRRPKDSASRIRIVRRGYFAFRRAATGHRINLGRGRRALTLFITGPRWREWGFWCPRGWVHWTDYVDSKDSGNIGKGCGQ